MFGLTGETLASQGQVAIDAYADVHERLTYMATQPRAEPGQFLEHLILRAEAIYNFQPPPARPWWKLWGKEPVPEIPALVADLRSLTSG